MRENINGIFLNDELPTRKPATGFYVFNLDHLHRNTPSGTHWVAAYCGPYDAIYLDTFGEPPTVGVERFLKSRYGGYRYNGKQIQDLHSNMCGHFCLSFGAAMQNNSLEVGLVRAFFNWIKQFSPDTKKNDRILRSGGL